MTNYILRSVLFLLLLGFSAADLAFDIKSFGACQGAPDDSTAIQRAVNEALASATDNIVVFSCLAPVGEGIVVQRIAGNHPVQLVSDPPGSGIRATAVPTRAGQLLGASGPSALILRNCDDCTVSGLVFDGSAKAAIMLGVQRSSRAVVANNFFTNIGSPSSSPNAALFAIGNTNNRYFNNTIHRTQGSARGMWIGNTGGGTAEVEINPTISSNTIVNSAATGIAVLATGGVIRNNYITDTGGAGIAISASPIAVSSNLLVEGNQVLRNRFHGIQSDSSSPSVRTNQITVRNNTCSENFGSGIYLVRANNWIVTGNNCSDNNSDGTGSGAGITVHSASTITISGNTLGNAKQGAARTQQAGISILGETNPFDVQNVTITGNSINNNLSHGIAVGSAPHSLPNTVDNIRISGNTFSLNGGRQVYTFEQGAGSVENIVNINN